MRISFRIRFMFSDLHGNAKKKEQAPDGSQLQDENVFDILQSGHQPVHQEARRRARRVAWRLGGPGGCISMKPVLEGTIASLLPLESLQPRWAVPPFVRRSIPGPSANSA